MSHPLIYFQKLYVINLPSRADRRQEMDEQLNKLGLDLAHPLVHLFPAIRPEDEGGFPSIGARGCFMSHLEVLRSAQARNLKRLLIVEDDLNFAADFNLRIIDLAERLAESDWGFFYGGYVVDADLEPPDRHGLVAVPPEVPVQTTHFLAVNGPEVIAACADYLEAMLARPPGDPEGGPMHVDGAYSWFRRAHPELPTLLAVPELGYQRSSRTDVHDLRWFDRMPLAREAAAWLRQWRNA
ncbi:MAG TPA: glycosyltransferase family 25 protein [Rhodocyclaceae bacterium]|nr:glycosyltransferase family 25 protein [Rhodocyclaceae bacterium]